MGAGAARIALHDGLRRRVPVERAERAREHVVEADERVQDTDLAGSQHPARHSETVLERHALLERLDVLGPGQREQVADPVEVDLPAGPLAEPRERVEAAYGDADVQLVGELRPHAAGRSRGGAGCQRRPLEQQHVAHARLGEVERDAGTDHPAADDHDVGRRGKRGGH